MVGPNDPTYDLIYGIAMEPLQDMANSANLIKICTPFDKEMASIDLNLHKHHRKQVMLVAMEKVNRLSEENSVRQEKEQQDTMMSEEEELENTLGRTMVPQQADGERALLSHMGTTITNTIRLSHQTGPLMVQSTQTTFVKNISGTTENWEKHTNQDIPVLVIEGRLHQSYKWQERSGKARLNFHPTKATMVGTPMSKQQQHCSLCLRPEPHTNVSNPSQQQRTHISNALSTCSLNYKKYLTAQDNPI